MASDKKVSAPPRDEWVSAGGLKLHYRDWGGSGQPIVLLHGLASPCHIWDLVAPILARDFAVVALDQRGHGESDKPPDAYDFAAVSADLHGFIEATGVERPILVGHSWGGDVALEYAVAYPGSPTGLCFVDGGTIEVSSRAGMTLERARQEMAPPDFTGLTTESFRERMRSRRRGSWATPQVEEIVLANFEPTGDGGIRPRLSRANHMRVVDAFWEHRPSLLYPRVTCPVLIMPARQAGDEAREEWAKRRQESVRVAEKGLARVRTVWMEDSVHDVPLQRPELVATVIGQQIKRGFFG